MNRGKHRDVEFRIHPPGNTGFKSLRARMIWFDPQSEEARCAEFEPVAVSEPEGLAIRVTIPPFGTCTIDGLLNQAGTPDRDSAVRRHIADRVTAMVEPGKSETFRIDLPAENLRGDKRVLLRVGYEGTFYRKDYGYVGVMPASAHVTVNGKETFDLPPYRKSNGFGRCHSIELEFDPSLLRENNEVTFSTPDNANPFMAIVASIIVQDRMPAAVRAGSARISILPTRSTSASAPLRSRHPVLHIPPPIHSMA